MDEVYWGVYQADPESGVCALTSECVIPPAQVPVVKAVDAQKYFGAGSGWLSYTEALSQRLPGVTNLGDYYPSAAAIARLAAVAWHQGRAIPAEQALPVYLRDQVTYQKT